MLSVKQLCKKEWEISKAASPYGKVDFYGNMLKGNYHFSFPEGQEAFLEEEPILLGRKFRFKLGELSGTVLSKFTLSEIQISAQVGDHKYAIRGNYNHKEFELIADGKVVAHGKRKYSLSSWFNPFRAEQEYQIEAELVDERVAILLCMALERCQYYRK